jgi:hypothetical protein
MSDFDDGFSEPETFIEPNPFTAIRIARAAKHDAEHKQFLLDMKAKDLAFNQRFELMMAKREGKEVAKVFFLSFILVKYLTGDP